MSLHPLRLTVIGFAVIVMATACQPKAPTPSVDVMATSVAQVASVLLTQTASAASPTPHPPTVTLTPSSTQTATASPTSSGPPRLPQTVADGVSCWLGGPGGTWPLDSHLNHGKGVQLLGVGSVPGWYIIRNPYFHRPCWISEKDLKVFPGTNISTLPVMTPGTPHMGQ
jgi:hypothetical protein